MNKKYLRNWWYALSAQQRLSFRKLLHAPLDLKDKILGNTHRYVPSRGKIFTGAPVDPQGYLEAGRRQFELLKEYLDLQPDHSVLDIGSGIGRTAIPFTDFLNHQGSYAGFDVVERGIKWCNDTIARDHPNFDFQYIPLFNDLYNDASLKANTFKFPYDDGSFDAIYSFSVFTHMQLDEVQNYLLHSARVLKHHGKILSTFFIYDDTSEELISKSGKFSFPIKKDGHRLMSDKVTAGNVAFHQDRLEEMMNYAGLKIERIIFGFWKPGMEASDYQDMVVYSKK
ncbi:MAG: class I SAM-dependent methyltransferase [Nonlabens sp.]